MTAAGMTTEDTTRAVLVTGASSGIGQATACRFAVEGFLAFGTSHRASPHDAGVLMLELDVRSDTSVARCVADVIARAGSIDVLVNNAGIEYISIAEETDLSDVRAVFDTDFFGAVGMTNAVLPHMRGQRRGRISRAATPVWRSTLRTALPTR